MLENLIKFYLPAISLTSIVGLIVLSIVAPSVLRMVASSWEVIMGMLKPIFTALGEAVVSFAKSFMQGLGIIFSNLSTLSVIIVVIISSGWYFRTWNDKEISEPLIEQIQELQGKLKKCTAPATTRKKG